MRLPSINLLAASSIIALSPPAAAQYLDFKAGITKQIDPANPGEYSIVELGTLIPRPHELKFNSLAAPAGVTLKGVQSPSQGCESASESKCRQHFTMAIDASGSKCGLSGQYVAKFDVACTGAANTACKPGQHVVGFSLKSTPSCTASTASSSPASSPGSQKVDISSTAAATKTVETTALSFHGTGVLSPPIAQAKSVQVQTNALSFHGTGILAPSIKPTTPVQVQTDALSFHGTGKLQ